MQAINNVPSAALPPQRAPELANLGQQRFEDTDTGVDHGGRLDANINGNPSEGADNEALRRAEISIRDKVTPAAPDTAQSALENADRARDQSADTVLQQARDILEKFDISNMTSKELTELRDTLEPLGVGRSGRNLVDLSV